MFQNGQLGFKRSRTVVARAWDAVWFFDGDLLSAFVLTAVQTWTGVNGTKHYRLAALVGLWISTSWPVLDARSAVADLFGRKRCS